VPAAPCLRNWPRGASANDKNPAAGREALGRSRGGLSTKIHLTADRRCRPITRILSPGQHGDCPRFIPLMEAIRIGRRGKGPPHPARRRYGRQGLLLRRQPLLPAQARDQGVIPVKEDQKNHRRNRGSQGGRQPAFDREQYKERNTVETGKPRCCHSRGSSALSPVPSRSVFMTAA
jgi:hypothetical protein